METTLTVLGMGLPYALDDGTYGYALSPAMRHPALAFAQVLIGGRPLLEAFSEHPAQRLLVGKDLGALYASIESNMQAGVSQVAVCNGDPMFYGLGNSLVQRFGARAVRVIPAEGCVQGVAAFLGYPSHEAECVSFHARDGRQDLCRAMHSGKNILLLTDSERNPAYIAQLLHAQGCTHYRAHIVGNVHIAQKGIDATEYTCHTVAEMLQWDEEQHAPMPRVVLLEPLKNEGARSVALQKVQEEVRTPIPDSPSLSTPTVRSADSVEDGTALFTPANRPFGLGDDFFSRSDNVMTKSTARWTALGLLSIQPDNVVWDLGAGTGSVAIEASRLAFWGRVYGVECRPERIRHFAENKKKLGAVNLELVPGRLPDCLLQEGDTLPHSSLLPNPDRVFIGGGLGGAEKEAFRLLDLVWHRLKPGGRVLVSCVLLKTFECSRHFFQERNIAYEISSIQTSIGTSLGSDVYLKAANQIFFVVADKQVE